MWQLTIIIFGFLASAVFGQTPDCSQRPPIHPSECCPGSFPKFITKELATTCGLPPEIAEGPPPSGGGGGPRPQFSCDTVTCVLKNSNVLTADGKIDKAAFKSMLEGVYSADWKPAIDAALNECMSIDTSSSPCPLETIVKCAKMTLLKNCPGSLWVTSDDCSTVKQFMQQCPWKGKPS